MSSFTYSRVYSSSLVRWDFDSPFLGQSIRFLIARYPLMPGWLTILRRAANVFRKSRAMLYLHINIHTRHILRNGYKNNGFVFW
jgi:hypothetical protein